MIGVKAFSATVLVLILMSAMVPQRGFLAHANVLPFDASTEYTSGFINIFPYVGAYYAWININGTHTIFLALLSGSLPSPVSAFVGEGYNSSSGSRTFVGNVLLGMEVYNDTDGNGYLDANYNLGTSELRYTIIMNASRTFTVNPALQKTIVNGIPHYNWGVTYGYVQANLLNPAGTSSAILNITSVSLLYDYSIKGNTTYLKTSYRIGNVTLVPPLSPALTLKGLSLSLLHATVTTSQGQTATLAGGSPYNSQTNTSPSLVDVATVNVDNTLAYEFQFKDNYTLQSNPPRSYAALYTAAPSNSVPSSLFQGTVSLIRLQDWVKMSLPEVVGLPGTSALNYSSSTLLYRIAYPTWGGAALQHDPTYVAHLGLVPNPPSIPPFNWLLLVAFPAALAAIILVAAVYMLRRQRKLAQSATG